MRKVFFIVGIVVFLSCTKKDLEVPIVTDLSMVEITVIPSFYGSKRFIFNIDQKQLIYKNLSTAVNDKDESSVFKASENRLFQLTHHETDSLTSLCKDLKSSHQNDEIAPDQWGFYAFAVKKNKELIEIGDGSDMAELLHAMVFLIRKKCNDEKVLFELKRYR